MLRLVFTAVAKGQFRALLSAEARAKAIERLHQIAKEPGHALGDLDDDATLIRRARIAGLRFYLLPIEKKTRAIPVPTLFVMKITR